MDRPLIVHPTDLSPTSEAAYYHALKLGLAAHANLSLVHFHDYATERAPSLATFPHVRDTLVRWGLLQRGAPQRAVSDTLGLYLSKGEFQAVDPENGLAKLLHDQNAEFMVLGTRGLRGLQRLFDRSFSEELARDARLPTLFVPEGVTGFVDPGSGRVRLENVLIPVAEEPNPKAAIAVAVRLCKLLDQKARLHLLHVGDGQLSQSKAAGDLLFEQVVRQGPVVETIVEVADEIGADVIVMATAGHKSFLDALRGSTTEEVLRKAGRPLLAVPAGYVPTRAVDDLRPAVDTAAPPTA
jgi:nucleotide-binding universal stress UspA family protein